MPSPTRRDLAGVFFRQRRPWCVSLIAVLLGCMAYGWWTRSYTAEMKILLRRGRLDLPMSAEPSTLPLRYDVTEEELNSEAELVRDATSLRKTVLDMHLETGVGWRPWRRSYEARVQRATEMLAAHMRVESPRKSRLLRITYEAGDPQLAAQVLQSIASTYLDKHLSAYRPSGEFEFFAQQAAEARQRVLTSEAEMMKLHERGSVEPALQRDLALQRLSESENLHDQAVTAVSEKETAIQVLEDQLAIHPERSTTQVRQTDNAQLLEKLKSTLLTLELRRTELSTRYQPEYRLLREVNEQIEQTKAAIAGERLNPVREETVSKNPQYEWAESQLEQTKVELQSARTRVSRLAEIVEDGRALSRRLGRDAITYQDLVRDSKNAEASYVLLARKQEEARVGDALDAHGVVNATIVQEPLKPVAPTRSLPALAMLGLIAGMVVSTGVAFVCDVLDPTIRLPDEIVRELDVPVLASLPLASSYSPAPGDSL